MTRRLMRGGLVAMAFAILVAGCSWWRAEPARRSRRQAFPPPIGQELNGPLIWAEAHPNWGPSPLRVHFSAEPLDAVAVAAWAWDFGDGSPIARRRDPVHTYRQEGVYQAHVWIRDTAGRIGVDVVTIRVGRDD